MNVVNFFEVLKTNFTALQQKIESTLLSRATYKKALLIYDTPELFADSPVIRAWAFFVVTNQGFAHKIGSWGYDKDNKTTTAFANKVESFQEILSKRLSHTQIENNPAHKVIESRDHIEAFFFLDPPYLDTNQGHY
jgi:DNA adenine methylase